MLGGGWATPERCEQAAEGKKKQLSQTTCCWQNTAGIELDRLLWPLENLHPKSPAQKIAGMQEDGTDRHLWSPPPECYRASKPPNMSFAGGTLGATFHFWEFPSKEGLQTKKSVALEVPVQNPEPLQSWEVHGPCHRNTLHRIQSCQGLWDTACLGTGTLRRWEQSFSRIQTANSRATCTSSFNILAQS